MQRDKHGTKQAESWWHKLYTPLSFLLFSLFSMSVFESALPSPLLQLNLWYPFPFCSWEIWLDAAWSKLMWCLSLSIAELRHEAQSHIWMKWFRCGYLEFYVTYLQFQTLFYLIFLSNYWNGNYSWILMDFFLLHQLLVTHRKLKKKGTNIIKNAPDSFCKKYLI